MRAFDTSVVVRVLVRDDPASCDAARQAWSTALASGGVFVSKVVLAEVAWALGSALLVPRPTIASLLSQLVSFEGVVVEDASLVDHALTAYAAGLANLSDYLIRETARGAAALPLVTFDAHLAREIGVELLREG